MQVYFFTTEIYIFADLYFELSILPIYKLYNFDQCRFVKLFKINARYILHGLERGLFERIL